MIRSISLKLISIVGLAVIIIIGIFAYSILRAQSRVLLNEVERHTLQLSETIKNSTRYDMLLNHRQHIMETIKSIAEHPCIKGVSIINKQGVIIYASDTCRIGEMVDKKAQACYRCHVKDEPLSRLEISERTRIFKIHPDSSSLMGMINPIYNEPSCWNSSCHAHSEAESVLGVLDINVCLKAYEQSMSEVKMRIVQFTLIAIIVLSFIIWLLVRQLVDRPVKTLVKATKIIASGNLNYRIQQLSNDEIGLLARSFNNMTQKLAEARMQLFQSDKMASLGRLAAGVAHEINNPLTGILTYSSFLLKHTKNHPELQEDLSVIVREAKRSREIVKSLLDFARQSIPKKSPADINEIINRAIIVIENQLNINNIKLIKNFDSHLPKATVDSNQIQQVLINLIENAAQAIGEKGGTIRICSKSIHLEPRGIVQIKQARCPKGHDLIDKTIKIDGMPSIKLKAKFNGSEGFINLHPVYGKNHNRYGIEVATEVEFDLSCPVCSISLVDKEKRCPKCGAPTYFFDIPGRGRFEGCTRKGCDWQDWPAMEKEGKKEYIEIKVEDNGCGIAENELDKIFDPFYSTKGQGGTGLGLAVIWGIVDNHGGIIKVESKVGKGTIFTVILPVAER